MVADEHVAHDFFVRMRSPNGVACARAFGSLEVTSYPKHRRWYCRECREQFYRQGRHQVRGFADRFFQVASVFRLLGEQP
jgi:hypothetical protein